MTQSLLMTRRQTLAGSLAAAALLGTRAAFAAAPTEQRFVFLILRGGLDGLSALVPVQDPAYAALRRATAIAAGQTLSVDGGFGLHPSLGGLHGLYNAGEAVLLHACASPYRERSHFDGQDVLENGGAAALAIKDGWLNRAMGGLPGVKGLAVGQNVPLVLRGAQPATTWAPSALPDVDGDTIERLRRLYDGDPILEPALEQALTTDALVGQDGMDLRSLRGRVGRGRAGRGRAGRGPGALYEMAAEAAASIMKEADGPRIGVLQFDGWDTHANQGGASGQLATRLQAMDRALIKLKEGLGPVWQRTAVVVATEFGRTAAENGTGGTDHGTAGVAFVLGGSVRGGRVLTDWPGLGRGSLYEGRDLRPTLDVRSVVKGVLGPHLGLGSRYLDDTVFPGSGSAPALEGLVV